MERVGLNNEKTQRIVEISRRKKIIIREINSIK